MYSNIGFVGLEFLRSAALQSGINTSMDERKYLMSVDNGLWEMFNDILCAREGNSDFIDVRDMSTLDLRMAYFGELFFQL